MSVLDKVITEGKLVYPKRLRADPSSKLSLGSFLGQASSGCCLLSSERSPGTAMEKQLSPTEPDPNTPSAH